VNAIGAIQENILAIVLALSFIMLFVLMWTRRKTLDCTDLITSPNGRMSRSAIGQCGGIVVAIWAPVFTTLQGQLDSTVLGVCLTYLGGVGMFTTYMRAKLGASPQEPEEKPRG
jgi:hypothetical protein